jgi:hypothetical protein
MRDRRAPRTGHEHRCAVSGEDGKNRAGLARHQDVGLAQQTGFTRRYLQHAGPVDLS